MRVPRYSMKRAAGLAAVVVVGAGLLVWVLSVRIRPAVVRFTVPYGTPTITVVAMLRREGLVASRTLTLLLFKLTGTINDVKAGVYAFNSRQTVLSLWWQLIKGRTEKVRVTVPEGYTFRQIAALLEKLDVCGKAEFEAYAREHQMEGFLFPETYYVEYGSSAAIIAEQMRQEFDRQYDPAFVGQCAQFNFTQTEHVTLASIIEKEARQAAEKPLVAAVFHNRLKKRMYLESCATVQYALGGWKKRLTYRDLRVDSPYNTYAHFGLPPGPVCNPGRASLRAAINPADSTALFFVADGKGSHQFFSRYGEHLKGREALRRFRREWQRENGE